MAKKIAYSVVVLFAVLGIWIAAQPSAFTIERSLIIEAPEDIIFGYINDFRRWVEWSPWDKLDPDQIRTYEGAESGHGAIYTWKGDVAGAGRMTITSSHPSTELSIRLEFLEPWESTNYVQFHLFDEPGGTKLVWRMEGRNGFLGKAFALFVDMDEMVGADFEAGLRSISELATAAALERQAEEEQRRAAAEAAAAMELADDADAPGEDE